jgi:hypothetical protein
MEHSLNLRRSHIIASCHYATANFSICDAGIFDESELDDLPVLQKKCSLLPLDVDPGLRRRSKAEYHISRIGEVTSLPGSPYEQDYGGEALGLREFAQIDDEITALRSFQHMVKQHRALARLCQPGLFDDAVREIVHLIAYLPVGTLASFSHPLGGHFDREDHVGLTCLDVSPNLEGGANFLFQPGVKTPSTLIRLDVLESILLGKRCWHGVTVMGSKDGMPAIRKIALFTYERETKARAREAKVQERKDKTAGQLPTT